MKRANLSKEERMLVPTEMDYTKNDTLYDQAKKCFKKFKGSVTLGNSNASMPVKLEPAFLKQNEEAFMAAGYILQRRVDNNSSSGRGNRGRGMNAERGFKKGGYASGQRGAHLLVDSVPGESGQRGSNNIGEGDGRSQGVRSRQDVKDVKTADIKSAFLQEKVLDRDVFLTPPKEAGVAKGRIWKLVRCLYGFNVNDASRQFFSKCS